MISTFIFSDLSDSGFYIKSSYLLFTSYLLIKGYLVTKKNKVITAEHKALELKNQELKKLVDTLKKYEVGYLEKEKQLKSKQEELHHLKKENQAVISLKEKEFTVFKNHLEYQKKAYERFVDFKTIEVNNSRLGPHFIKNIISHIYNDLEENNEHFKSLFGYYYIKKERQNNILAISMLKNIFQLLDYNVSAIQLEKVALSEEIHYLNIFIKILTYLKPTTTILFDHSFSIEEMNDLMIKPTLLLPFIENALKHGNLNAGDSYIDIKLFRRKENTLYYSVRNSFEAAHNSTVGSAKTNNGFGITALKELLEVYYPGSKLVCEPKGGNQYFLSELQLTLE